MKTKTLLLAALTVFAASARQSQATTPLNTCNTSGECRALLASVYTQTNFAYVVLQGHLIPSVCTAAGWGYYWTLPLSTDADRARYAMLLAAFMAQEVVELRSFDASCTVVATNVGE